MSLSIFSFGKHERGDAGTAVVEGAPQRPESSIAVAEAEEMPRKMILDLENLTPETLEAFFPSERTFERVQSAA